MEGESNGMEGSQNRLCQAGCGFFGGPATDGLCSVCYKETVKKKQQPPGGSIKVPSPQRANAATVESLTTSISFLQQQQQQKSNEEKSVTEEAKPLVNALIDEDVAVGEAGGTVCASSTTESASSSSEDVGSSENKKKTNRCAACRKKVGLTGFECRCGGLFCSTHRYSDKHNCSFDYRQLGAEEIRKNNPIVVSEKINKI